MSNVKRRPLTRYGLAMLVLVGAGLLAVSGRSQARPPAMEDYDCWFATNRICNVNYYPQCYNEPDGTSCFRCPYTVLGRANCVRRTDFTCTPDSEIPFDCGPRIVGICVSQYCFGDISSPDKCRILNCGGGNP